MVNSRAVPVLLDNKPAADILWVIWFELWNLQSIWAFPFHGLLLPGPHMMISFMRPSSYIRPRSTLFEGRGLPNLSPYTVSGGLSCSNVYPGAADSPSVHKYCVAFCLLASSIPWMAKFTHLRESVHLTRWELRHSVSARLTRGHGTASSVEINKHCGVP